jgi:hypothetical protein
METTIKNFSKCELDKAYFVNEHELIIRSISIKESGKCRHNLYTGEVDGEFFNELNSPQLKKLLGIDTIEYNRDGGDAPKSSRKEITPESIDAEVVKVDARWDALNESIIKLLGDEPTDVVRHVLWDLVEQKKKHLREELEERMMMQMAAKASREAKAKDAEKDEARKQLCAELGTTLSAVKKMAEAMGASVDEMIQNLQAMKK